MAELPPTVLLIRRGGSGATFTASTVSPRPSSNGFHLPSDVVFQFATVAPSSSYHEGLHIPTIAGSAAGQFANARA